MLFLSYLDVLQMQEMEIEEWTTRVHLPLIEDKGLRLKIVDITIFLMYMQ